VAYVDSELGRLLDGLKALGLDSNTLIVLTADHGEEFLDHGGFEHGHTLYEELLHVPLVFRLPGLVPSGRVVSQNAGLVDVAPTLCELAGIPTPPSFHGQSLVNALQGRERPDRPLLAHGNFWGPPLSSWRAGDWKLILTPGADGVETAELFDLASDPLERENLAARRPEKVAELREELDALCRQLEARARGTTVELDEELQRRLGALGYGGPGDEPPEGGEER
jgi:arylsulfatase A-like enzyme